MRLGKPVRIVLLVVLVLMKHGLAQSNSSVLRGQVTDPSGAAVTGVTVVVVPPVGAVLSAQTNGQGVYEVKALAPGKYTVDATAPGFALYENDDVEVTTGKVRQLNISLSIQVQEQKVVVSDSAPTIDVNPASNASAIVLSGKELEALPDDPDELQSELGALAGPAAGPNGGQIYVDGFTAGQLPPKAAIREIRINQNPFSSEYDKLGYGRIEIFTKPGTDKFHGQFLVDGNDSAFNTPNPFAGREPPYESTQYSGNIGGPLNKNASFSLTAERRNINNVSAVNAQTLDSNLKPISFTDAVPNLHQRTNISPRLDYSLSKNNTLVVRYQYVRDTETNDGVGPFSLASQAYNTDNTEHTLQLTDTQIFGAKIVNETRFQYLRERDNQIAQGTAPTVNVEGAFSGGGSNQGNIIDHQEHYELQNYTSVARGNQLIKFGARLRTIRDANDSTSGFNGTFTFPSITAYEAAEQTLQSGAQTAPGANLFTITTCPHPPCLPAAEVTSFDASVYVQDDWRLRPNLTLSYGLRFEGQNLIHDHADWAPRLGIAYRIGGATSPAKTVLRAGFGIFYDRFTEDLVMQAERLNGITLQQYVVNSPAFFPVLPSPSVLASFPNSTTIYKIDPGLRAPYTLQTGISLERQLAKSANLAVSYLNSRGFDEIITRNSNAPLPGTYESSNPNSGVRPLPGEGNIYEYVPEGVFRQDQLIVNSNLRVASKLSLFGYYVLNSAASDTSGPSSFPSNSYDIREDYGRAAFDVRNRLFLGGTIALRSGFRLSPFLIASSGTPYNITVAQDLNGDSILNDRPAFASGLSDPANVVVTKYGSFDTVPVSGETLVPINDLTGPGHFTMNVRLSKTFGFGPEGGGPAGGSRAQGGGGYGRAVGGPMSLERPTDRRYDLTFSIAASNVFNDVNLQTPSGTLGSPFFGKSNALAGSPFSSSAANRRIDLQAFFSF